MLTTNRGKIAKVAIVIRKRPFFATVETLDCSGLTTCSLHMGGSTEEYALTVLLNEVKKLRDFFDNVANEMEAQQKWGLQFPLANKLEQERKLAEGDLS